MSMTWLSAIDTIRTARNQAAGKPLQRNTRLFVRGEGDEREFGIVFHGTEVVTIHANDTYTLRNNGWRTNTTLERIRTYAPVSWQTLITESGEWFVRMTPNPKDPRPEVVYRTIPKPYTAGDFIREPVKSTEDCVAGQMVTTHHVDELVEIYRREMREHDVIQGDVIHHGHSDDGAWDRVKVKRTWDSHVYITENANWDEGWSKLPDNHSPHSNSFINDDGEKVARVQCAHCVQFDAEYEACRQWMFGARYGERFDAQTGYKVYREMMDRFHNDKELWQEAYIEDFRARRAYLKADREWDQRNRVPFYDGITIDSEGYTARLRREGPSPAKLRRHEREVERIKKRIDKYVDGYIKALVKGMAMPGPGDCWFCGMKMPGDDHLFSHMEERYYVPSLAVNAMREHGRATDIGIYMLMDMNQDAKTMGGKPQGRNPYGEVRRALTKYMRAHLVPEPPTS
jgi:hypothetical protein